MRDRFLSIRNYINERWWLKTLLLLVLPMILVLFVFIKRQNWKIVLFLVLPFVMVVYLFVQQPLGLMMEQVITKTDNDIHVGGYLLDHLIGEEVTVYTKVYEGESLSLCSFEYKGEKYVGVPITDVSGSLEGAFVWPTYTYLKYVFNWNYVGAHQPEQIVFIDFGLEDLLIKSAKSMTFEEARQEFSDYNYNYWTLERLYPNSDGEYSLIGE